MTSFQADETHVISHLALQRQSLSLLYAGLCSSTAAKMSILQTAIPFIFHSLLKSKYVLLNIITYFPVLQHLITWLSERRGRKHWFWGSVSPALSSEDSDPCYRLEIHGRITDFNCKDLVWVIMTILRIWYHMNALVTLLQARVHKRVHGT